MPTEYVVDASAVAKLFLDEPGAARFRDHWYALIARGVNILAPPLLRYEVGNLIARNLKGTDESALRRAWRESLAGIRFGDEGLVGAFSYPDLTFYDAAYVSLAAVHGAALITFDARMATAAKKGGVPVDRLVR